MTCSKQHPFATNSVESSLYPAKLRCPLGGAVAIAEDVLVPFLARRSLHKIVFPLPVSKTDLRHPGWCVLSISLLSVYRSDSSPLQVDWLYFVRTLGNKLGVDQERGTNRVGSTGSSFLLSGLANSRLSDDKCSWMRAIANRGAGRRVKEFRAGGPLSCQAQTVTKLYHESSAIVDYYISTLCISDGMCSYFRALRIGRPARSIMRDISFCLPTHLP